MKAEPVIDIDHEEEDFEKILKDVGGKLPEPQGWKLLIALPKVSSKTAGGIYKPENVLQYEETGSIIGLVIAKGDLAYADHKKFPNGSWCNEGDYIIMRSYSGTRMRIAGQEFRLINDDTVEAVVSDPRGVMKAV